MSSDDTESLGVALSGGGHRAALFGLGVLMYLVDSKVNRSVRSIASVSGGSIVNGVVARECSSFDALDTDEFDQIARRLVRPIVRRGLLRSSIVTAIYVAVTAALVTLAALSIFRWHTNIPGWLGLAGLLAFGAVLISRGMLLEFLLGRAYFRSGAGRPSMLGELEGSVEHVFTATELSTGRPFYFVYSPRFTSARAMLIRTRPWTRLVQQPANNVRLRVAVRASAAFPGGFPPKRMRVRSINADDGSEHSETAYLADGGVWNNLGTQWWGYEGGEQAGMGYPLPTLLIADASAPVKPMSSRVFAVPLIGDVFSTLRSLLLMYPNTVEPRVEWMRRSLHSHIENPVPSRFPESMNLVVRLSTPIGMWWRNNILAADADTGGSALIDMKSRGRELTYQFPEDAEVLADKSGFKPREVAARNLKVKTSLSKISAQDATSLVLQGYCLAMEALHVARGAPLCPAPSAERLAALVDGGPP